MTLEEFTPIFGVLAVQLRAPANDPQHSNREIRAYYAAMKDLEVELVQLAAVDLAKNSEWFPKSSEWIAATRTIEGQRKFLLADTLRQLHRKGIELCTVCGDTGWVCDADGRASRCPCQNERRLEVIGRRQLPAVKALLNA